MHKEEAAECEESSSMQVGQTQPDEKTRSRRTFNFVKSAERGFARLGRGIKRGTRRLASAILNFSSPRGQGHSDRSWAERFVNVITCTPLMLVGAKMPKMLSGFGRSVKMLGLIAALYHSTPTKRMIKLRVWARKMDYWVIAASSCLMRREVSGHLGTRTSPLPWFATTLVALHSPTAITIMNYLSVEISLRSKAGFSQHLVTLISALFMFKFEKIPLLGQLEPVRVMSHGLWHILAALSIHTAGILATK